MSRCLVLIWLVLLLTGCGPALHKQQAYVFGTLVEITVAGESAEKAQAVTAQVLKDFDELHRTLHPWEPGTLERINGLLALGTPAQPARISLPPGLIPILADAQRLSAQSEGLFNPAIGNLVRLWGFHAEAFTPRLPEAGAVAALVNARPSMADLRLEDLTLIGANPAVRLDLGGYAKGYALDLAADLLRREGVKNALINIGGNVMALGDKNGTPWKIGIQHPRRAGALAVLELRDGEAVGTSGDYQRFFELNGRRYSHLIDPRSGQPVTHAQAVTVLVRGPRAGTLSDVASKPLFIAGPEDWQRLAAKLGVADALFIDAAGNVQVSAALNQRLSWEKPVPQVRVVQ